MNPLQIDIINSHSYSINSPVIVALDFPDETTAMNFIRQLDPRICQFKIGNELFTTTGRMFLERIIHQGFKVFLDLKYHDIPNTVQKACQVAADMGVWMIDVHASGGSKMMEAAANGIAHQLTHKPILIGVTILTSMDESDLNELTFSTKSISEQVLYLATLAQRSGLDGVVCSGQEVSILKNKLGQDFLTVTPGIRLAQKHSDDQKRIMTPQQVLTAGADYMVIGRPITQAADPLSVIDDINLIYQKLCNNNRC